MKLKIAIHILAAIAGCVLGYYIDFGNISITRAPSPSSVFSIKSKDSVAKEIESNHSFSWQQFEVDPKNWTTS